MNPLARKQFHDFLLQLSEDKFSRIGFKLEGEAYTELMGWIIFLEERTAMLDNEGQLFLILLILEASSS